MNTLTWPLSRLRWMAGAVLLLLFRAHSLWAFVDNQNPAYMLGTGNCTLHTPATQNSLYEPYGLALATVQDVHNPAVWNQILFVADAFNYRVMGFDLTNGI